MTTHEYTPEQIWGDTAARADAYMRLSRKWAGDGDVLRAVHAQWAADIAAVQALVWERIMAAAPTPDEEFFSIGATVGAALLRYRAAATPGETARDCVAAAREGLLAAFDEAAVELLRDRFAPLDHLSSLPHPAGRGVAASAYRRVGDIGVTQFGLRRRQDAGDAMAVAARLEEEGRDEEAMKQAWLSCWAGFEAYLADAAAVVGDESLATMDLRWALACEALAALPALPSGLADAVAVVQDRLAAVVGPVEDDRLRTYFATLA